MPVCRKPLTVSEHAVDKLIQPIANSLVCELSCVENETTLESRVLRDSQVRAYLARSFENGDNLLSTNSRFS